MMNFESDDRNLPQKISEDIISFILNIGDVYMEKRIILNNLETPFWIDSTGRLRNENNNLITCFT
mgnify:CR=1 FL=1